MPDHDEKTKASEGHGKGQTTIPMGGPWPNEPHTQENLTEEILRALAARYEILTELGRGGMGIAYKARDRETGDIVALKILKPDTASRPELIERFKSELLLTRRITHKNVCRVYDLNRLGDVIVISMEYVEGESLQNLLSKVDGFSIHQGLDILRQVIAGLQEAHGRGIVHRDIKPSNILIGCDRVVRVLDFGIARSVESDSARTSTGMLLGTPSYMSPEQAQGRHVDQRSDIYSLGLVMFEMFTGQRVFVADTPVSMAVKHVQEIPKSPKELEPDLPERIHSSILKCLEKDPAKRFQSVIELEAALWGSSSSASAQPSGWKWALAGGLAAVLASLALVAWITMNWPRSPLQTAQPLMQFAINLPPPESPASWARTAVMVAFSPDGKRFAYVSPHAGSTQLFVREVDQLNVMPLPGTSGAYGPFFSPDGLWLAFFAEGKLKRVSISDGAITTICSAPQGRGGTWTSDGTILFTPTFDAGLWQVAASGGTPRALTTVHAVSGESTHRWPQVLAGGKSVLFTVGMAGKSFRDADIAVQLMDTGERRTLIEGGTYAHYVSTGHLVFARGGELLAVPFDVKQLEVTGSPIPFLHGVMVDPGGGAAQFSFSDVGSFIYVVGTDQPKGTLVRIDRQGRIETLLATPQAFTQPKLSPNGQRLAVTIRGDNDDVWLYHLGRGTLTRLTVDPGEDETPIWAPNGERLAFAASRQPQTSHALWKLASSAGPEELLFARRHHLHLTSWSNDGRFLAFTEYHPDTAADIWVLPLQGEGKAQPVVRTQFNESNAKFSPDGRLLAYVSDESGQNEVYVQQYPGPGEKWQISMGGGWNPVWNENGRELFYQTGDSLISVDLMPMSSIAGKPRVLFKTKYFQSFDVTPDGQHFLMIESKEESEPIRLNIVLNWFEKLGREPLQTNR